MKFSILSIAGSDSCGGAGIQADIKTATALKTYIATAITCITAQNTQGVFDILYLPTDLIKKQIEVVLDDIKIDAIKIGMVGSREIIEEIARVLKNKAKNIPLILDPVMVATSGDALLKKEAISSFKKNLIPLSYLITPNIPEAELLSGIKIKNLSAMKLAAEKIISLGARNVLIKGGHINISEEKIYNLLVSENGKEKIFTNKKLKVGDVHGTGCSLASAVSCFLAKNYDLENSIKKANHFVYRAIKNGGKIGGGSRVLNHFF
jgi:hydroxymethylpyrimidine/phosphomethylpyrimidine kinase